MKSLSIVNASRTIRVYMQCMVIQPFLPSFNLTLHYRRGVYYWGFTFCVFFFYCFFFFFCLAVCYTHHYNVLLPSYPLPHQAVQPFIPNLVSSTGAEITFQGLLRMHELKPKFMPCCLRFILMDLAIFEGFFSVTCIVPSCTNDAHRSTMLNPFHNRVWQINTVNSSWQDQQDPADKHVKIN